MKSISQGTLFLLISALALVSTSVEIAYAEIKGAFLIRSTGGVQVSVFKGPNQKSEEGYLLIEGTGTEWDDRLTAIKIKDQGAGNLDYNIEWKNHPYTLLAGRSGSYSLSLPKPFKEYEGLSRPYREEIKVDVAKLEALIEDSSNTPKK